MPKNVTLASVRGRGIRLALPGPTKKSGSTIPTRSSTQQPSPITQEPTGSSTQITKNVVESSTQPPSSQTAKQTKADYAFPIQTLLALQDAGLTKLHKKSWADICDSSDEDEIDLTKLISQMATQNTICNDPKGKIIAQTMPPQSNQTQPVNTQLKQPSTYISKNKFSSVLLMEPEFWEKSHFKVIPKVFPPGFHFRPTALNKTRQFYEFILVDSDSVSIKHYKDPKDATNITYSTIQILNVLTPNQFGKNPNNTKKFSNPYDPIGYSYWDYVDAWTRVFWLQNNQNRHSWLIYFKKNTNYQFPNWFSQWWDYFGPLPEILPPPADEGFKIFTKKFDQQETSIPADLQFFSVFSLTWVFSWQYRYGKQEHPKAPPMLQRNAYVKWWSQFDAAMAHPDKVRNWFKEHPKFTKPFDHEESVFLNQKAQIAAALAGAQSKETLARHLQQIMQMIEEDKKHKNDPTPSEESSSDYNQNKDDCFGINLGEE
ncbi:uncharacterized protein DS421_3g70070 [Arachis hypogaea]|nr:uncharacterized protein DS421_3g70070 [Arachis hypogaea]